MNERVREFIAKAGTDTSGKWMGVDNAEKFAELIVQECADVTHRLIVEDGKEFPVKSVAYRLKEHFGVKE